MNAKAMSLERTMTTPFQRMAIVLMLFSIFAVSGCETTTHAQEGQIIGAVIGGVVGSHVGDGSGRTAAIILGSLAGGMIGQHVGQSMDDTDRLMAAQTLNDNRTGETQTWVNPDTGYRYTFTPTRTYESASAPCREFRLSATIGNQSDQDLHGTACLQADGSWLVQ